MSIIIKVQLEKVDLKRPMLMLILEMEISPLDMFLYFSISVCVCVCVWPFGVSLLSSIVDNGMVCFRFCQVKNTKSATQ